MVFRAAIDAKYMRKKLAAVLLRPAVLACLPAVSLGIFWAIGQVGLITLAVALPVLYFVLGGSQSLPVGNEPQQDAKSRLYFRDSYRNFVINTLAETQEKGGHSAIFSVEVDDADALVTRYGQSGTDAVMATVADRVVSALRDSDAVTQASDFRLAACLSSVRQLDLELCIQLAGRIQAAIEDPISLDGTTVYVTASIGFCQSRRSQGMDEDQWREAARIALSEAKLNGPAAIRAFSDEMKQRKETLAELREDIQVALNDGQIVPWYQPQISTDTGHVTGFEALARWHHPSRGMIAPADFLPAIEQAGLLERLAEVMMSHALTALKAWDAAGVVVPCVGVNFAGPELSNPRLVEKVKWELDRFELSPDRLAVEVLETVVTSTPDDVTTRNINALSALGCRVDLDDFGTGHASIASIRRFSVSRIKIDRSFVMKADRDPEQQRMISAILTMAERLNVETLAEGVETVGEHALLAQLGCDHVQGFGIGKPMPFDDTLPWIEAHTAKLVDAPLIMGNRQK